jgi:uncharacterized delta-60 repeat protein
MRKIILLLVFSFSVFLNAQNYLPDPTFGTNGALVTNYNMFYDNDQAPSNCFYLNDKYVFTQKTQLSAFNYDGSVDFSFGTSGYSRLSDPTLSYKILSSKVIDNYIYLTGVKTNGSSIYYGFVARMSFDGILDNSFGINGVAVFSMGAVQNTSGQNESGAYDLVIKDAAIFVVGTTYYSTASQWQRMFVSKLSLDGIIDTSFDAAGYKTFPYSQEGMGKGIFAYENDLLLVADGKNYYYGVPSYQTSKVLIKIDENGNYITGFGTNGVKVINVCTGCAASGERINRIALVDNALYMLTTHSEASPWGWSKVQKVDISTLATTNVASADYIGQGNYLIDNDKIYVLGCGNYPNPTASCPFDFNLARRNLDGTLDTSFNQTGLYNFNFNNSTSSIDRASVLIKHADGKIMMAGYTQNGTGTTAPNKGFAIARIADDYSLYERTRTNQRVYYQPA